MSAEGASAATSESSTLDLNAGNRKRTPAQRVATVELDPLFVVDSRHHGNGKIVFSWHPGSELFASSGISRVVHIFDRHGAVVEQIVPPSPSMCIALQWDSAGDELAILQENSKVVVLWNLKTRAIRHVDCGHKDLVSLGWSKDGKCLAIGSGRGRLLIYNAVTGVQLEGQGRGKARVVKGAWDSECGTKQLAYVSDDRQITVCTEQGTLLDQIKMKTRPVSVAFGCKASTTGVQRIMSINLESKAIMLYDLAECDNAIELAFQPKYGTIVSYRWFGNGYLMIGFTSGYVVVVSTHLDEIGREQFCGRFHTSLGDIAYCPASNKAATCGDGCFKIIDVGTWREVHAEVLEKVGKLDRVAWTNDGKILSVSTQNGCFMAFNVRAGGSKARETAQTLTPLNVALYPISGSALAAACCAALLAAACMSVAMLGTPMVDLAWVIFFDTASI